MRDLAVVRRKNAPYPLRAIVALEPWSDLSGCHARRPRQLSSGMPVESRMGASTGANSAAPFPIPAHQTGRAHFRHPAFRLASS